MHRWLVLLITFIAAAFVAAPRASAGDSPIGRLGETLRVDTGTIVADVTVSNVVPVPTPPGFGFQRAGNPLYGSPVGDGVWRADVTVHSVSVPTPFQTAL